MVVRSIFLSFLCTLAPLIYLSCVSPQSSHHPNSKRTDGGTGEDLRDLSWFSLPLKSEGMSGNLNGRGTSELDRAPNGAYTSDSNLFGNPYDYLETVDWKQILNELFFINIFKSTDSKDSPTVAAKSVYFSPESFQKNYDRIVNSSSSEMAFRNREILFDFANNFASLKRGKLKQLEKALFESQYLRPEQQPTWPHGEQARRASEFIKLLRESTDVKDHNFNDERNYFNTVVGQSIMSIFSDVVFVIVPDFGTQLMGTVVWPELIEAANRYYGRSPILSDSPKRGLAEFYNTNREIKFDVVQPIGHEIGDLLGADREASDALAVWILKLKSFSAYKDKKLVLLGYGKGASDAATLTAQNPAIRKDVLAILSLAGMMQGALPAEDGIRELMKAEDIKTFAHLSDQYRRNQDESRLSQLKPLLGAFGWVTPASASWLNKNSIDDLRAVDGLIAMTNYERVKWSLLNLHDRAFDQKITFFQISVLTDVKDFLMPEPFETWKTSKGPTIIPQAQLSGEMSSVSFNDGLLFNTALNGFALAPGGLFDGRVAWADSKALALDQRPLSDSFSLSILSALEKDLLNSGRSLPKSFEKLPRNQLLAKLYPTETKNLNYVDLGDVRGTHLSVGCEDPAWISDLKVPSQTDRFPRRALQASTLETLALFRLMGGMKN